MWDEASAAGLSERYQRGRTPHTTMVWWARRPHSAMRAVVERTLRGIEAPRVLDTFAGGATIPIEARRFGANVTAVDNNELAVFINRLALELAPRIAPAEIAKRVRHEGRLVLDVVERITAPAFPLRGQAIDGRVPTTYLWTYELECQCGRSFLLTKRPWLSRKNGISLPSLDAKDPPPPNWAKNKAQCPHCETRHDVDVRHCRDRQVAVVYGARGRGKTYIAACEPPADVIRERELALLGALGIDLPASSLPVWSGIVNPALYGIREHGDVLNPRQRIVALAVIGALRERFDVLRREDENTARFVVGVLSGLIDQVVDWNSRLSMWIPQNEQVGRAFSGPGVAMLFDYAEVDPVAPGPANLRTKLERIADGAAATIVGGPSGRAIQASAQRLPFDDGSFDAVVTDPPYYDNIAYTALADFFYAWKRPLLERLAPKLFGNETSRQEGELVASRHRHGANAHVVYVRDLTCALREIQRVLTPDGRLAIVYSHASVAGWAAFVEAFVATELRVTEVLPLAVERRQRPRAMNARSVDTCVTFMAKVGKSKERIDVEVFERRLERALKSTQTPRAWPQHDAAMAYFASGLIVLMNHRGVDVSNGIERIEARAKRRFPGFELLRRRSM